MKIIIVGATGTIGRHITKELENEHEVIKVGSKSGDFQADITSPQSIEGLFKKIKSFDALISIAGHGHFGPLREMTDENFRIGLNSKLMGQINLVLIGQHYINPKGSFTLTSGIIAKEPVALSSGFAAVGGALESFGRAAALEFENNIRINIVSPSVVEDSPTFFSFFPGHIPVSMQRVTQAYVKSVLGASTGKTIEVH
jgi:NAD(P)-dependent dehydrogenase (short-subunit alcohol dehydrogenase family)